MLPIPDAAAVIASSSAPAAAFYGAFNIAAWFSLGVVIAAFVVVFLIVKLKSGAAMVLGKRRGRGRRRR